MSPESVSQPSLQRARLSGVVPAGFLAILGPGLVSCDEGAVTGREWVNSGAVTERRLGPTGEVAGVLYADRRLHPNLQLNYSVFAEQVARIFKKSELFNRTAAPFRIYLMWDAADFAKYGGGHLDDAGEFVRAEGAIYLHGNGAPLVDRGQNRRLVRELARAVIDDMYQGKYPRWFAEGLVRYYADGAFDDKAWYRGLPDPKAWRSLLADASAVDFAAVRAASDAEFEAMGRPAVAMAHAAVYLLRELDKDQFAKVVWQFQLRDLESAEELDGLLAECVPGFKQMFADPVASLWKLRPDLREYLECGLAEASPAIIARCRKNAATYAEVGGYWYQLATLLPLTGGADGALAAFERARSTKPHRWLRQCLDPLIDAALGQKDVERLGELARQALRTSVQPTPRMCLALARALKDSAPDQARQQVAAGLSLPSQGFDADVNALRELQAALGQ